MSRKIVAVWVSLAMMFGFIVIVDVVTDFTPTVKATMLYVNTTGSGGAYTSIQDAIDAANHLDTIFVYNGTYNENLWIRTTIDLIGEDMNTTIIWSASHSMDVIWVQENGVKISGFTIIGKGVGGKCINLDIADNCKIYNNNISNNYTSILLYVSNGNEIRDNIIYSKYDYGIYNKYSNGNYFSGNKITENGFYITGDFLENWNSHDIDVTNTVNNKPVYYWKDLSGGTIPLGAGQVILANCTNIKIVSQECTNTSVGIHLGFSSNCNITSNNLSNNIITGIYLSNSNECNITDNNAFSNGYYGIHLTSSYGNNIYDNNITNNSMGIRLLTSNNNNIINNIALNNTSPGISIESSNNINIKNNTIIRCGSGIYIYKSERNHNITHNIVILNNANGISLSSSKNGNISDNHVSFNGHYGIFSNITDGKVINNNASSNNMTGIRIQGSNCNSIMNNYASFNADYGIFLYKSNNNNLTGNNASNNRYGIFLQHSDTNNLDKNLVYSNDYYGIYFTGTSGDGSDGNNITDNDIWDNKDGIRISGSINNKITLNNISHNRYGINLGSSTLHNITYNKMIENGILIGGGNLEYWNTHNINISNTVNGKPVYYWKNLTGGSIPPDAGEVILANCTNIIIKNLTVTNGTVGIELGHSSNNYIANNNASSNNVFGIFFSDSNNNNISDNTISDNDWGLYLTNSRYNNITNNYVYMNNNGTELDASHYNNISNNDINTNYWNGIFLSSSYLNNLSSNNVSFNYRNGIHLGSFSKGNIISNNNISSNHKYGTYLYYSRNNYITNNTMSDNGFVIWGNKLDYWNSHHIDISNTINGKPVYYWKNTTGGIIPFGAGQVILANCSYVEIENQVLNNASISIELGYSSNNIITNNNASLNSFVGICLYYSNGNNITNNSYFLNKEYGLYLFRSSNNKIYHNNFINNINQAFDDTDDNYWDNGYPSGGNYWSEYIGIDNYKGPSQDIPGSDGIGDSNYSIELDSVDNYPLMEPYISKPLENYTVLKQGWNLISIPLIQEKQTLTKALEMIDGYYDAVQWYNLTDGNDPWKHYKIGKPFGNDLFEINETMGFWIYITKPGDTIFVYNGTHPTVNQTISLIPGWNLVGYPSKSNKNRTNALNNIDFGSEIDAIWTYNATTQSWKEITASDNFEVGRGYWIHSKVTKTWIVPI